MGDTTTPRYIPINRDQQILQPLDIDKLIAADHPARKIWAVVAQLDLSRFEQDIQAVEGRAGRNTFPPQLLISIWIYAYSKGLHSAREIERQTAYEPGLQWLGGLRTVNHHKLSDFRVAHGEALRELFTQVLAMLTMNKLITLERIATDGTKIRAHVNKKSFSRAERVRRHLKLAQQHVEELERQEAEEQTTRRQQSARSRAAREQQQRLEEALEEIQRLRAEKKHNKKKEAASLDDRPHGARHVDLRWRRGPGLQRSTLVGCRARFDRRRHRRQRSARRPTTRAGGGSFARNVRALSRTNVGRRRVLTGRMVNRSYRATW